nr:retrovirus-related Pol polyprotein from transposon TNT 1-94 [Tanacetum cinerariifolium]
MENLNEVRVKELRSDNEKKFRNHKLEEFYDKKCTKGDEINFNENKSFLDDEFRDQEVKLLSALEILSIFPTFLHMKSPHSLNHLLFRSKIRDSDAASAFEFLYVNFLFEMQPMKLIEALEEEWWIIAMQEELNQFERNKVYNQQEWIYYEETFALVARLEAIRIFLAYAAYMGFMVYQMDVKSAFLNGKISEEVYVQKPPRFESSDFPNHVSEAEYVAISGCCTQVLWIKSQLADYDVLYDKIHKLQNKKKNMELNTCYTRFLSLIFEKLLGENYISNDITLVKPHSITVALFQKSLASKVALTSNMLKVDKLFQEPEQSLISPSREVNADDTTDKSLSRASVQLITQPIAPTDLKTKKKRIPPSSKLKSPYKVMVILPKKQVTKTQHANVTVATVKVSKSLVASKLEEEQVNQPSAVEAKKGSKWRTSNDNLVDITPKDNEERDASDYGLRFMPNDDLVSLTGFDS